MWTKLKPNSQAPISKLSAIAVSNVARSVGAWKASHPIGPIATVVVARPASAHNGMMSAMSARPGAGIHRNMESNVRKAGGRLA
jgi:hypothetical protein